MKLVVCSVLLALLTLPVYSFAQDPSSSTRHTISGYIEDAATGEKLSGATVYVPARQTGTATNRYGFYSLTLPADSMRLVYSYVGYQAQERVFRLDQDTTLTVRLQPTTAALEEVTVEGGQSERIEESTRMGRVEVPVADIESVPAILGEVDVLKTLQLLPGVQGGKEGTSGLYVRGGGPGQNLILLDGVPVYNASHLFGFLSVFNSDAIQNVEMTKGGFPARYGGRLSSVVDITMKEGNMKEFAAQGALGLLSSKLTVEGPIIEDRTSFLLSGRRTYLDLIIKPLLPDEEQPTAYFYDLNAKLNHRFSPDDRLFFSVYTGDDRFGVSVEDGRTSSSGFLGWGNITSALRWNHLFSDKLFSNTTLTFTRYRFDVDVREELQPGERFRLRYASGIRDWSAGIDFDYVPQPAHYVRFGAKATWHTFTPGALTVRESETNLDTAFTSQRIHALETYAYAEDDMRLTPRLKANVGVHGSLFSVAERTYASVQPRLSARYLLGGAWSVKGSFVTMRQYIHLLSNAGVGLPTDLWVPATRRVPAQSAWQGALGLAGSLQEGRYEISLEGYYKKMDGLIAYEPGAAFVEPGSDYQDKVLTGGTGTSYGAEVLLQGKQGRTTGWLGYTLGWTNRQFDALNDGEPYPYRYDRRHEVNLVLTHRLSGAFDASATWIYSTGEALTLPRARYLESPDELRRRYTFWTPGVVNDYGTRNGFRMPAYHRLDLGLQFYFSRAPNEHMLSLSLYNAYNHKNPFFVDFETNCEVGGDECERQLTGYAIFPVIPSLSYRFQF